MAVVRRSPPEIPRVLKRESDGAFAHGHVGVGFVLLVGYIAFFFFSMLYSL